MLGFSELGRESRLWLLRQVLAGPWRVTSSPPPGGLGGSKAHVGVARAFLPAPRVLLPRGNQDGYDASLRSQLPKSFSLRFSSFGLILMPCLGRK